jgi:superfamily II DNA or RNA helicase
MNLLQDELTYKRRVQQSGNASDAIYKTVRLYQVERDGLLVGAGCTERVLKKLRDAGHNVTLIDRRPQILPEPKYENLDPLREGQAELLATIISSDHGVICAPTGCHAAGTLVRMSDGSTKRVESVVVGDRLIGPDGKPRSVRVLCRGRQQMYRVTPVKGEAFVVNEDHVLSLRRTNDGKGYRVPKLVNLTVRDWLSCSKTFKHMHKLWRAGVDNYDCVPLPLLVDPYFLGVYLGNGGSTSHDIGITTADQELIDVIYTTAKHYGLDVTPDPKPGQKGATYYFVQPKTLRSKGGNALREAIRKLGLYTVRCEYKFVPIEYMVASRSSRLEVLAGLLDTDGHLDNNGYEFSSKSIHLASAVVELSRGLGLAAYMSEKPVNGEMYYRVIISGDCSVIPVRVKRKQASIRRQKKDVLTTGFSVEAIGEDDYYGFELDGDHLYLTADFTVHHNSGKSWLIRQICKLWPEAKILICSPFSGIIHQMVRELQFLLGPNEVGQVGDGACKPERRVVCAISNSLMKCDLDHTQIFIFDEVHRAGSPALAAVISKIMNARMYGFSASPIGRSDNTDMEVEAAFGPIIAEVEYQDVQKSGGVVPIEARIYSCAGMRDDTFVTTTSMERHLLWRNRERNQLIAKMVKEARLLYGDDAQILISVAKVDHAVNLGKLLPDFELVYRNMDKGDRFRWERDGLIPPGVHPLSPKRRAELEIGFRDGTIKRAIATCWGTGMDFPQLNVIIRADAAGGKIANTQIPGRVTRSSNGKTVGIVMDLDDCFNQKLARRAQSRFALYRKKGWSIVRATLSAAVKED